MTLATRIAHAETLILHSILQYGHQKCVLSFNGGKDCTVLLHLLLSVLKRLPNVLDHSIPLVYVSDPDPFPEIERFINSTLSKYPIFRPYIYRASIKEAFAQFSQDSGLDDYCCFVGVRSTDPFCGQLHEVQATDNEWPKFLRIHPILHWDYSDIWSYIDENNIDYCCLYSQGFSSIGPVLSTTPNPHLQDSDGRYKHARFLTSALTERAGRLQRG